MRCWAFFDTPQNYRKARHYRPKETQVQLIEQYPDLFQAEDAAMRLRNIGILTHISSINSFVMSGYVTGAFRVGLWVVLDAQHQDACAFLKNPQHEVTTGLPEDELIKLEGLARKSAFHFFNQFILVSFVAVTAAISILVYFFLKGA